MVAPELAQLIAILPQTDIVAASGLTQVMNLSCIFALVATLLGLA